MEETGLVDELAAHGDNTEFLSVDRGQATAAHGGSTGTGESARELPPETTVPALQSAAALPDTRSARARRWSRLNSIAIKNFKAIAKAEIPLANVTILVGPNGSGKSSALQAIHWAARAASYILPKNTKEMIAFERLDYLPSSEPLRTAHNGELHSEKGTPPTEIVFSHFPDSEEITQATVRIRAARNKGGITASIDGGSAVTPYKQRVQFITAYIPGLAGLSERESILAQPSLRRQAASGDAGGVLRNVLLNLADRRTDEADDTGGKKRLKQLNDLVSQVHPGISVDVWFDEREDYHISAVYSFEETPSQKRSLETAATGVLQVIQIFAYLVLFEPKIMLIDEPDAHLHPDKQERLIETLERAAKEFETQVVLTTHSPHITRAASPSAKLVWMNEGSVQTDDDEAIRRLLGWGGLDKAAFFFIEDEDDKPIRAILRQWPDLSARIAVCRCFGVDNLPQDKLLTGMLVDGELKLKAIIHRDRDFMTEAEVQKWGDLYKTNGVFPWVTIPSDVEGYFCEPAYLAALYGITEAEAESWRNDAAQQIGKAHDTYLEKRKNLVRVLWPNGGSPNAEELWTAAGGKCPQTVKGKKLLGALKNVVKSKGRNEKLLDLFTIPSGFEMALDMKSVLLSALSTSSEAEDTLPS